MALFGRNSQADLQRQDRIQQWIRARSPFALFGGLFGILAVLDFFTPLGLAFGLLAIGLGIRGMYHLRRQPELLGARLCRAAIVLGALGFILSVAFVLVMY